jgi:ATP-dependent DNA helicase RecQ
MSPDKYQTLSLTPPGRDVMLGRVTDVRLAAPTERFPARSGRKRVKPARRRTPDPAPLPAEPPPAPADPAVVEALKSWRTGEARARKVPPYFVLHDRVLERIAAGAPRTLSALEDIPGIGPAKLEAYGRGIVEAIATVIGADPSAPR